MKTNVVNEKVMYGLLDKIAQLDNANKTDKYFEHITTKILMDLKATNLLTALKSHTQTTIGIWMEIFQKRLKTSPLDIDGTSVLKMHPPPVLTKASELYGICSM